MPIKSVPDSLALDIPYPNPAVFSTGRQQLPIWREADRANVKISFFVRDRIILKLTDLLAISSIKYLRLTIATCGNVSPIMREADAAYHRFVDKIVKKLNIEYTGNSWIKHSVPVLALSLEVIRKLIRVQVCQHVADIGDMRDTHVMSWRKVYIPTGRRWTRDLGRLSRVVLIRHWLRLAWMLLRGGRTRSTAVSNVPVLAQAR